MRRKPYFTHQFVEFLPEKLADCTVYISIEYKTVAHKCGCGCGNEVNTPLSPAGWRLIFDGVSVSLYPSIGNWGFPCRSHYWIEQNELKWADQWSEEEIGAGRRRDSSVRQDLFGAGGALSGQTDESGDNEAAIPQPQAKPVKPGFWGWLKRLTPFD